MESTISTTISEENTTDVAIEEETKHEELKDKPVITKRIKDAGPGWRQINEIDFSDYLESITCVIQIKYDSFNNFILGDNKGKVIAFNGPKM